MSFPVQSIGIIGNGVVGSATARAFLEWADVRVHDRMPERSTHALVDTLKSDLVFVCLPTPQKKDSLECDTSFIEEFFAARSQSAWKDAHYVLRSTVPIGTTQRLCEQYGLLNLVHSPEFLTARCAFTDAQMPARNIVGCPTGPRLSDIRGTMAYINALKIRFPGVPVLVMDSNESEAVKLMLNSFFAVKLSFFNECRVLADTLGLHWDRIIAGILSDGRIAHSHTQVPGHDGRAGWGGNCLPKDIANLMDCVEKAGLSPWVMAAALGRNRFDRERELKQGG